MARRDLKDFAVVNIKVYYRGGAGILVRALSMADAKEDLQASINFDIGTTMLTSIDVCKGNGTIGSN